MTSIRPPSFQPRPGVVRAPRATPPPRSPSLARESTPSRNEGPKCAHCQSKNLVNDNGSLICADCGVIVEENANFRSEIEFDELASGAAAQRGQHVGAGQTHQRTFVSRIPGVRGPNPGFEPTKAADRAKRDAQYWFGFYKTNLNIQERESNRAAFYFDKAYQMGFYRGRTIHQVAVTCLYLAVRSAKQTRYPLMLIDFAELYNFNVFDLGKVVKDLHAALNIRPFWQDHEALEKMKENSTPAQIADIEARQRRLRVEDDLGLVSAEQLIERFCAKLEFGDQEQRVAQDAAKIAKTMNRDWMTDGRRPAGVAGAAIIIASRMNNFRRTLREVVLVAKVTETTVGKRIEEFKETMSSGFSVQEFREKDLTTVKAADPPSYYRAQPEWKAKQEAKKKNKKSKKAKKRRHDSDTASVADTDAMTETEGETENENEDEEEGNGEPASKRPRIDADGFAVPALPSRTGQAEGTQASTNDQASSHSLSTANNHSSTLTPGTPHQRSKTPRARATPQPPSEEELAEESALANDIHHTLAQNANLDPTGSVAVAIRASQSPAPDSNDPNGARDTQSSTPLDPDLSRLEPPGPGVTRIEYPDPRLEKDIPGPLTNGNTGNTATISLSPTLRPEEFDDDDDVANCALTETERIIKEAIWVTENADWLRAEHKKKIKRELKEREMREKGINPDDLAKGNKGRRRKDGRLVSGRAGDVSYLNEDQRGDREGSAVSGADGEDDEARRRRSISMAAVASVKAMLKQRGTFSRRVDYDKLSQAYMLPGVDDSSSNSQSRNVSQEPGNTTNTSPAPLAAAGIELPPRTEEPFFRPGYVKGRVAASKRRARQKMNEGIPGRSDSRSGSAGATDVEETGDEDDAEFEEGDEGTPEAQSRPSSVPAQTAARILPPTPAATQQSTQQRTSASPTPVVNRPSGLATPEPTQQQVASAKSPNRRDSGLGNDIDKDKDNENDNDEGDEDDYNDDDEDEEEDDDDEVDPEIYLNAGNALGAEEEVVEDDF